MLRLLVPSLVLVGCRFGFEPAHGTENAMADGAPDSATDSLIDVPPGPPPDYCTRVPALGTPATIDGMLEPGLALQLLVPVGWQTAVSSEPVPDVPVQFAIAHRPDHLYFFVDVADPGLFPPVATEASYCGDGVELYVDHDGVFVNAPDFDTPGTSQLVARAPADASTPRTDGGERYAARMPAGAWTGTYVSRAREGGYTVEAVVVAADLGLASWTLASGNRIGVDLSINVSTPDGSSIAIGGCPMNTRLGQFFLRVDETLVGDIAAGAPYYWPTAYCSALLD